VRPGRRDPWELKTTQILKANDKIPVRKNNSQVRTLQPLLPSRKQVGSAVNPLQLSAHTHPSATAGAKKAQHAGRQDPPYRRRDRGARAARARPGASKGARSRPAGRSRPRGAAPRSAHPIPDAPPSVLVECPPQNESAHLTAVVPRRAVRSTSGQTKTSTPRRCPPSHAIDDSDAHDGPHASHRRLSHP